MHHHRTAEEGVGNASVGEQAGTCCQSHRYTLSARYLNYAHGRRRSSPEASALGLQRSRGEQACRRRRRRRAPRQTTTDKRRSVWAAEARERASFVVIVTVNVTGYAALSLLGPPARRLLMPASKGKADAMPGRQWGRHAGMWCTRCTRLA